MTRIQGDIMKIKVFWENLKRAWNLSSVWCEVKKYIKDDLDMGEPIEIFDKKSSRRTYCPKGMPSDYYSQSDCIDTFVIKTDKGNTLYVEQGSYGIVWDSCNDRIFSIKNDKGEELVKRSIYSHKDK